MSLTSGPLLPYPHPCAGIIGVCKHLIYGAKIEPRTSYLLSRQSANWAKIPNPKYVVIALYWAHAQCIFLFPSWQHSLAYQWHWVRCRESSKAGPSAQRMGQVVTESGCGFLVWEGVLELSPENAERAAIVLSSALLQSLFSYRFICLNLFVVFRIFPVLMSLLNV